jgi:DNA replication and repair protein RecF
MYANKAEGVLDRFRKRAYKSIMSLCLHKLNLSYFRNYETLRLSPEGARIVVLTGENGAGKTNLLEAVSLLAPGRGLRGAEIGAIRKGAEIGAVKKSMEIGAENVWAVAAEIETPQGALIRLGTGQDREGKRRVVRINGKDIKNQGELSGIVSAVWLTPQMDRLFLEGAAPRRRFLDRLVYAYEPDHALRVSRSEKNMRERMHLLQMEKGADPRWLSSLEAQMAADFTAIADSRLMLTARLQSHVARLKEKQSLFPAPLVSVVGDVEARLEKGGPALTVEEGIKDVLKQNRSLDAATRRTALSAHRSDMDVIYDVKNMDAAQCSTGEQKGLLLAIVLAHALMMQAEKGFVPLLLLDEVAAHLDAARREQLFGFLKGMEGQVWLTGTDESVFSPLQSDARFFTVAGGTTQASSSIRAIS